MFLDAEGRKLLKHAGPRTVKGFEESFEAVREFLALEEKAAEGDAAAATELFIRQLRLEWFDLAAARTRADALEKVSSKQKREIAQLLIDLEVRELADAAGADAEKRVAAGERFAALWKAKEAPQGAAELRSFWTLMADFAEERRDKKLFKRIVAAFEDTLPSSSAANRKALKALEERLERFPRK